MNTLLNYLDENNIKYINDGKTADLNSIKIGGIARLIVYPNTLDEYVAIIKKISIKFVTLGRGTNVFFTDDYYDGVVIVTSNLSEVRIENEFLTAQCGASLTKCCYAALDNSLSGLEFSYGIPGSIGGAVYMNASAYSYSFSDVIVESKVFDLNDGVVKTITNYEHQFSNKKSIFQTEKMYILESKIKLFRLNKDEIYSKMKFLLDRRKNSQPLSVPSSGSTFKKPVNSYASLLIDKAGLKGYMIGGAQVSDKHAGFIINRNHATAKDVLDLINFIKKIIKGKYDILLEEEVIYLE